MDDIVKQAMAKWPNVPHCYGWLALDARGAWRMRDERAQQLGLAGDKITQAALLCFINRNYTVDEHGCWYFQNGPQRVYVNLETCPFIARTDPQHGLVLHTGEAVQQLRHAWLSASGTLLLDCDGKPAQLDDRDLAPLMQALELDGQAVSDAALLAWLDGGPGQLVLRYGQWCVPLRLLQAELPPFQFTRRPAPP